MSQELDGTPSIEQPSFRRSHLRNASRPQVSHRQYIPPVMRPYRSNSGIGPLIRSSVSVTDSAEGTVHLGSRSVGGWAATRPSGRGTVPARISMSTRRMCLHRPGVAESCQSGQVQESSKVSISYRFPDFEWTTYLPRPTNRMSIVSVMARRVRGLRPAVRSSETVLVEWISFLDIYDPGRTTVVPVSLAPSPVRAR